MNTSTIQATLGLDTSSFSAKAKGAEKDLKAVAEGVGNIGKVFTAGGTVTAVMGFFNGVIASARDSKDGLDENVQAVRRFGDSFDAAKALASDFSVATVGTLNRVGEAARGAAKSFFALITGSSEAHQAQEAALAATERAAAQAEMNLAEAMKHQKEFTAVTAGLAKIEADRAAARAKSLTDEEKIAAFQNAAASAEARANDASLTTLERRQAMLALRQAELALEEALAASEKQRADETAKRYEAIHKADMARMSAAERIVAITADIATYEKLIAEGLQTGADADRTRALIAARRLELVEATAAAETDRAKTAELLATYSEEDADAARRLLPFADQITLAYRERLALSVKIKDVSITEEERRTAIVALREKEKELAGLTADQQKRLADEAEREAAARKAAAEEFRKITPTTGRKTGFNTSGKDYKEQGTEDLADVLRNLRQQRTDQQVKYQSAISPAAQFSTEFILDFIDRQIMQVEAELRARKDYQRRVDIFGPDTARDFIGGPEFNRLKDAVGPNNDSKRTADTLEQINDRLRRAGFSA